MEQSEKLWIPEMRDVGPCTHVLCLSFVMLCRFDQGFVGLVSLSVCRWYVVERHVDTISSFK